MQALHHAGNKNKDSAGKIGETSLFYVVFALQQVLFTSNEASKAVHNMT